MGVFTHTRNQCKHLDLQWIKHATIPLGTLFTIYKDCVSFHRQIIGSGYINNLSSTMSTASIKVVYVLTHSLRKEKGVTWLSRDMRSAWITTSFGPSTSVSMLLNWSLATSATHCTSSGSSSPAIIYVCVCVCVVSCVWCRIIIATICDTPQQPRNEYDKSYLYIYICTTKVSPDKQECLWLFACCVWYIVTEFSCGLLVLARLFNG